MTKSLQDVTLPLGSFENSSPVKVHPNIFRESDIRGLVGDHLTADTVELIGKAIGTFLRRGGGKFLCLGRDVRESSDLFRAALSGGVTSTGCHLIDIGRVPTPVFYFALYHLELHGGVMITGSHNPADYNGFKISRGTRTLHGGAIQMLRRLIENKDFETGHGRIWETDVREDYLETIIGLTSLSRPLKVVVDGGNACFGLVGPRLLKRLGLDIVELFCEPDGSFPNHHPDPTVERNLVDLQKKVIEHGADLGIGFDGDVDRIGVVDETGRMIYGDELLMLFARDVLKRHPRARVIGEVKCSQHLFDDIRKHGGVPIMTAVGHSLIKKKMWETGALLAGEMSGHICFADEYFGYDDAIYAACRLMQILSASDCSLGDMVEALPKAIATPEIRVNCPDESKFEVVRELKRHFHELYPLVDIDGIRIDFGDGWALVRASNTQPVLTLRFEADNRKRLEEIQKIVQEPLMGIDSNLNFYLPGKP